MIRRKFTSVGLLVVVGVLGTETASPQRASGDGTEHRLVGNIQARLPREIQLAHEPPVPLRADGQVHRFVVGEGQDATALTTSESIGRAVAACHETEDSVYCNTLGASVWGPARAYTNFADDLVLAGVARCALDRYVIRVTGDKDQDGTGTALGGYALTAALYSICPGNSVTPEPIPGTELIFSVPAAFAGDVVEVTKVVPATQTVPLPARLYLGMSFTRAKCGVVVGAPALRGFSADRMDIPAGPCDGWFGGFPRSPHSSVYAEIYTREPCNSTFIGYHNSGPDEGPFSAGKDVYFADDVQVAVPADECNLVAYEMTYRGAIVSVDLRTLLSDPDADTDGVIPGTRASCVPQTPDETEVCRVEVDPPVPLPLTDLWAVYRSRSATHGPVRTCRNAQIGTTGNFHRVYNGDEARWVDVLGSEEACWGAFDLTLYCEGSPRSGACCDMFTMECLEGENDEAPCLDNAQCGGGTCEAVCREVPEQNCASSIAGTPALWQPDAHCGGVCSGGGNDGQSCTRAADCPAGQCTGGPFTRACGLSACCLPKDDADAPCSDLTRNECLNRTVDGHEGRFQIGDFCGLGEQRCPLDSCLGREGDCLLGQQARCQAGPDAGDVCEPIFNDCLGVCLSPVDGQPRESCIFSCPFGERCARRACTGGDLAGELCDPDLGFCVGGLREGDVCCPGGVCQSNGVCNGGGLHGRTCCPSGGCFSCPPNGQCEVLNCVGSPGCADPFCCTDVCEALGDNYCCLVHWDWLCADTARDVCDFFRPPNDQCFNPIDRTSRALAIDVPTAPVEALAFRAMVENDPGLCCQEEDPGGPVTGGAVWFRFVAPPAPDGQTTSSVWLSTCDSQIRDEEGPEPGLEVRYRAEDSLLAVFATEHPDRGVCTNRTDCSVELQDCEDDSECVLDDRTACEHLVQIACNDDDPSCRDSGQSFPRRSSLCVTDLVPGEPYWVMVAGKDRESIALPRACSQTRTPCATDEFCDQEMEGQTCQLTPYCSRSYTTCFALADCPSGESCQNNPGLSAIIPNTGVFGIAATTNCTPARPRMVNDLCEDAWLLNSAGFCSISAAPCVFDSDCFESGETCEPLNLEFDLSGDVLGVCVNGAFDGQPCPLRIEGVCGANATCQPQAAATFDCPGPPDWCAPSMQDDVWYRWTAPVDARVEMDTCERVCQEGQNRGEICTTDADCSGPAGSCRNPDTALVIYDDCECPVYSSTIVDCSESEASPCLNGSRVSFDVKQGHCYLLRLSGHEGSLPAGRLTISLSERGPTGACCDEATGFCTEDITQADCEGTDGRYGGDNSTCTTIDPSCIRPAVCGNGIIETGEECDDGRESATCDADCTLPECGDGVFNASVAEECDDGGELATCDADCTLAQCGDSTLNTAAGEQCDDGNLEPDDGCDGTCHIERIAIPTTSGWSLIILTLLLLAGLKAKFGRRRAIA